MTDDEILYSMALSRMTGLSLATALHLYNTLGSAKAVFDHRHDIGDIIEGCTPRLLNALHDWGEALRRAEAEMEFILRYEIEVLPMGDANYPARLRECPDAPLVLYYRGTASLNAKRIINIVGTRRCTQYGHDLIRRFMQQLQEQCPEVLVVSGLAYGIDISAHRQALACGMDTVAVLAHGLDTLYPPQHRETAKQMLSQGGLLTEYMSSAHVDKGNFVRRNRIVAGISDATIIVESAAKGGGLITCEIAQAYNRAVMAFPGAVGAPYSEGCNNLIRDNGASLITCADDFVKQMGWQTDKQLTQAKTSGIERSLFPSLSPGEAAIVRVLGESGDLQINQLAVKAGIAVGTLNALLFQLEMKGVVKPLAGGNYHLLK